MVKAIICHLYSIYLFFALLQVFATPTSFASPLWPANPVSIQPPCNERFELVTNIKDISLPGQGETSVKLSSTFMGITRCICRPAVRNGGIVSRDWGLRDRSGSDKRRILLFVLTAPPTSVRTGVFWRRGCAWPL